MLKLERLELSGFKSFVDPVTLDFAGRMTAIVGPNGCGKSNIADAMVWVLGERSAKSLRGDKMEDVIFAGAANRKPLGMADVQLTLTTDAAFEGSDDDRLTIGRRLYRDGQSQYLINGKRVRLKEIRDKLMDTGLGIRTYSVIEQGKIGMILSGKPQERRRLLEEAAGITRYKERRRIAEIKLEEARANLARLDDIVSEVERALRSLKRQAGAARRRQKLEAEYDELLRRVLLARWAALSARRAELRGRLDAEVADESERTADLHRREAGLAESRERLEELAAALAERHRRDAELAARIEGKQEFLKGARHRLEELGERLGGGRAQSEARARRREQIEAGIEALRGQLAALEGDRDRAASEVSEDDQRIDAVQESVRSAESRLEALRGELMSSLAELTGTRNRLHREQLEHEKGELRRAHVEEELGKKRDGLAEAAEESAAARRRVGELEERRTEIEERLAVLASEGETLAAAGEAAAQRTRELEEAIARLERRREVLTELARAQAARRREVREALDGIGLETRDFLGERLRVPAGWEASLDLYFDELADAVLLPAGESGAELARTLAAGRGTFRLLGPADSGGEPATIDDPAVLSSLGEAVGLPPELAAGLPPAYLVDGADAAERLARRHPGIAFVSRERIWAQSGVVHVRGAAASPGQLAREQEGARIAERLPPLEADLAGARDERQQIERRQAASQERVEEQEELLAEARRELAVATARHEDAAARERRLNVEHTTLESEAAEIGRELERIAERRDRLQGDLAACQERHDRLETDFDAAQQRVQAAREERESARTSGAGRRGRLELLEERLDSQRQEAARLSSELDEGMRLDRLWSEEAARLESRREELRGEMEEAEADLQQALEERDALREVIVGEQERLDEQRGGIRSTEKEIEEVRTLRDGVRERIGDLRVEEAEVRQEIEHLAVDYRDSFDQELPEPAPELTPEHDTELAELETDLERCRAGLDRLGPVNLLAAEELDEQSERHEFLTTQRADVAESVESLQRTIRDINKTSSERFLAAFLEVNEHFGTTFAELFRGGAAEMRLMDEDDVLECGIEIVARPPGKRLQNIMLLSGGEKALTAIALLFALFQTKPSPFCILDEVDAPLDDVNTLRFVELLKRRSHDTQFIVVTHNKLTMEAASTLYGVTMQEQGVSSLVTVELDEIQPEQDTASATATA